MVKKTKRKEVTLCGKEDTRIPQKRGQFLVKGLHNLGNTCYLNSSLQCLSRSPYFLELLSLPALSDATLKRPDGDSVRTLRICLPVLKTPVTSRFTELCASLRDVRSDSSGPCSLNPAPLRESIIERYPRFSGFGQQDSHEILRALLDCLKQEELMRWRKGILEKLSIDIKNVNSDDRQLVRVWGRAASVATMVDRLFGGILVSSLQCCVCGTIRPSFEPFLDLSLPIADAKVSVVRRSFSGKHEGVGKSKQELKRERKKKSKKQKPGHRRKIRQEMDNFAGSSDGEVADEPAELEPPLNNKLAHSVYTIHNDTNGPNSKRLEQQVPTYNVVPLQVVTDEVPTSGKTATHIIPNGDPPCQQPSDVFNGIQVRTLVISRTSSTGSPSLVNSSKSSNGSCADAEESDEDRVSKKSESPRTNEASCDSTLLRSDSATQRQSVPVETNAYLADQLSKLHLNSEDFEPFCVEELLQASRLSQIPLRSSTSERPDYGSGDTGESLYTCLSRFTAPEQLCGSNRIRCDTCSGDNPDQKTDADDSPASQRTGVYRDAIRRDLILEPPPLLTIHLKRFQQSRNNLQKSQKPIKFPLILDLSPFCSALYLSSCDSVCYRLYGVVEHMGRLAGGHYVAYVAAAPPKPEQVTDSPTASDRLQNFLQKFVGSLNHPPKWPFTVHDLVRRLRRCNRSQLLQSVSELSTLVNQPTESASAASPQNELRNESDETDKRAWFRCSDTHVSRVPLNAVLDCQPFLLFYERISR